MTRLSFRHLIEAKQITTQDIDLLIGLAEKYRTQGHTQSFKDRDCHGTLLGTLFFEPSTRTRFSFESAMLRLGGNIMTLEHGESSSVKKGETLSDTGRIMSNYADIITIRHKEEKSADEFAKYSSVPVINAGDGANQHPTQSLVDIYTIFCEKKRLNNLKIGILGDLKHSRTIHSLLELLSRYSDNQFTLISHPDLRLNPTRKATLEKNGCHITQTDNLEEAVKDLDLIYATRVQEERFANQDEYEKVKNSLHINKKALQHAKSDMIILHPLPRINEIDEEVDHMPCAKYFAQANYGVYIRMALLTLMTQHSL